MKRYSLFICCCAALLVTSAIAMGQNTVSTDQYVKYNAYYADLGKPFLPWKQDSMHQTMQRLKQSIALLTDEKAPAQTVQTLKSSTRVLTDEAIFANRKNSVFLLGKVNSVGPAGLNFDLIGTAFAISADGVCVTNYHVLKNLIQAAAANKDSVYFIETVDKKVYLMEQIMTISQNNDLAVFKVNTHGNKLNAVPLRKPAEPGEAAFCISHPFGRFYYFSKGIVARNAAIDTAEVTADYNKNGKPPIRMEITADYGVGSSGGPILDQAGNLIGIVISTAPIVSGSKDKDGKDASYIQMMVKDTSPVKALNDLLGK